MDTGDNISQQEVVVTFNCQVPGSPEFKDIQKSVPISTLKKSGAQVFIFLLGMFHEKHSEFFFCCFSYSYILLESFTHIVYSILC